MNPADLLAELDSTPDIAGLSSIERAAWLNEDRVLASREVPASLAKKLLIKALRWEGIVGAAMDVGHVAHDAAYAARSLVSDADISVDFSDPVSVSLLGSLESAGLIGLGERDALVSLSSYRISIASKIGWGGMSDEVLAAWIDKVEVV